MMADTRLAPLGRGWHFPLSFTVAEGPRMVSDLEDIQQSLRIIFSTQQGERIMRPLFGGDMQPYVFENISDELVANLQSMIVDALLRDEPRVEVIDVVAEQDRNRSTVLKLLIKYRVRGTGFDGVLDWQLDTADSRRVRCV